MNEFDFGAPFADGPGYDFSEYPFHLYSSDVESEFVTETAGTYSLKIWANSDPVTPV